MWGPDLMGGVLLMKLMRVAKGGALALVSLALVGLMSFQALGGQGGLTLEQAVKIAMERNPSVLSAAEELKNAHALVEQAKRTVLPSITAQGSFSRSSEEDSERNNYGDLSLSQTLYAGGTITGAIRQAEANLRKARHNLEYAKQKAAWEAWEAFLKTLLAQENLRTALNTKDYYEKAADMARKRALVGLSTKLDASRMEQKLRESQGGVTTAQGNLRSALMGLSRAMGLNPTDQISVMGSLSQAPSLDVPGDVKELQEVAVLHREDLKALREDLTIQEESVRMAGASMRPSANLAGAYRFYQDKTGSSSKEGEWTATLNVTIPLLDFGKADSKILQERTKLEKLRISLKDAEDSVREAIQNDLVALNTARQNEEIYRKNLDIARDNLHLAEVGYREGVNTQLDLISARKDLTDAELRHQEAMKNLLSALKDLWFHRGELLTRISPKDEKEGGAR